MFYVPKRLAPSPTEPAARTAGRYLSKSFGISQRDLVTRKIEKIYNGGISVIHTRRSLLWIVEILRNQSRQFRPVVETWSFISPFAIIVFKVRIEPSSWVFNDPTPDDEVHKCP